MAITVLFFANLRETLGVSSVTVEPSSSLGSVAQVRDSLAARGEPWGVLTASKNLRAAVNQKLVGMDALVQDGDEVAFFPPVTGG
jgi:sulfur-carrier protein